MKKLSHRDDRVRLSVSQLKLIRLTGRVSARCVKPLTRQRRKKVNGLKTGCSCFLLAFFQQCRPDSTSSPARMNKKTSNPGSVVAWTEHVGFTDRRAGTRHGAASTPSTAPDNFA
jgi:hypothetical protein